MRRSRLTATRPGWRRRSETSSSMRRSSLPKTERSQCRSRRLWITPCWRSPTRGWASTRSRGGLGLGLPLAKGMVELHGGGVSAHSDGPGQGARFTIKLPLGGSRTGARGSQRPDEASSGKHRVLVIEDNVDAATSLRDALSGPEGLEKARQFDPEFVLCALGLPGMDGYAVARAFRSDEALKDVHLVAVGGCALPEDVERASGAGFERHLSNPSSVEKIEEVLSGMPRPPSPRGRSPSRS